MSDRREDDVVKELRELRAELEKHRKERSSLERTLTWVGRLAGVLIVLVIVMIVARIVGWVLHNIVLIGLAAVGILMLWVLWRKRT